MTDEELNARLDGWQVDVESVTDRVMQAVADTPIEASLLAELLGEVRALRREVSGLRAEVAALRQEASRAEPKPSSRATIKGYPLLPYYRPEDDAPLLQ